VVCFIGYLTTQVQGLFSVQVKGKSKVTVRKELWSIFKVVLEELRNIMKHLSQDSHRFEMDTV